MDFSSFTPILKQSWALWKPWPNLCSVFIFISHFFRCISQKQSWVREEHQLKLHRTTWKLTAKPQSLFNHNEMFLDPKCKIMPQGAAQIVPRWINTSPNNFLAIFPTWKNNPQCPSLQVGHCSSHAVSSASPRYWFLITANHTNQLGCNKQAFP